MKNENNVERFYNKTTQQIMRFQPLFTSPHGEMIMGVSLDSDIETDYDNELEYEIKRGQMVMVSSPNSIDRGNRIKMSYKGKDLFTYERNINGLDIPNWIYKGEWKNYEK